MNKYTSQKFIAEELKKINKVIDLKIIRGESYKKESARHRALIAQMRGAQGEYRWFMSFNRFIAR